MTDQSHHRPKAPLSAQRDPGLDASAGIGAVARRRIGRDLRLLYRSVVNQPLPERLTRLIDELAADSGNRKGS